MLFFFVKQQSSKIRHENVGEGGSLREKRRNWYLLPAELSLECLIFSFNQDQFSLFFFNSCSTEAKVKCTGTLHWPLSFS